MKLNEPGTLKVMGLLIRRRKVRFTHTQTPGIYTVNLTASNENGTASKNIIISVTEE